MTMKEIRQTPGPSDYKTGSRPNTSKPKIKVKQTEHIRPSSRECSLAVPLSGEPFSPFGALKKATRIMRKNRAKLTLMDFV